MRLGRESVLDTLRLNESTFSGGCKDKEMVQLVVDGSDVESMVGRVELKDPFGRIHGKLQGRSHGEGGELRKQTSSISMSWNISGLRE